MNVTQKHFKDLAPRAIKNLGSTDIFSDVTLVASDGRSISVHKAIIAMFSETLQRILVTHLHPNPVIYFHNIRYEVLKRIKDFIYLGEILVPNDDLAEFLRTGSELGVHGLVDIEAEDIPGGNNVDEEASMKDVNYIKEDTTEKLDLPSIWNEPEYGNSQQVSEENTDSKVLEFIRTSKSYQEIMSAEVKLGKNEITVNDKGMFCC